jgi:hypothetical protein
VERIMCIEQKKAKGVASTHLPPRVHSVPVPEEDDLIPDETPAEAESELGQNEWIDPEIGELAEGEAPPRLEEE